MAIFHMSISNISRGKGQSATASAAYRSGEKLYSERYDKTSFYPREVQPEAFILKPEHAPEWTLNREQLWNEVEKIEKAKNSRLAKEFTIALPIELNDNEQKELVQNYVQKNFVDNGMVSDIAIHRDDKNNPHAHVLLTNRPFLENGKWGKKSKKEYILDGKGEKIKLKSGEPKSRKVSSTDWDSKEKLQLWRKNWAGITNQYLEKNGFTDRITEKSFADRAIDKRPTIHEGYVARDRVKKGKKSDRIQINIEIRKDNYEKENKRKKYAQQETQKEISNSLSPKEKSQLMSVAKELKLYVNYENINEKINYENLSDKQRMLNNWKNATKFNQKIKPNKDFSDTLEKIDMTEQNINQGTKILNNQYERIFEKYYPSLSELKLTPYKKVSLAEETLKQDKVLNEKEIKTVFSQSQDKELDVMLQSFMKNPYVKNVQYHQERLHMTNQKINKFYKDNYINSDELDTLNNEKQKEIKKLFNAKNRQINTLGILDKYFSNTIGEQYPTVEMEDMSLKDKEVVSQVIDYYGDRYNFDKVLDIAENKIPNKYTSAEQKIGVSFIYKIRDNKMTKEDYQFIKNNPDMKEIYDTVNNPSMRKQFLNEVSNNKLFKGKIPKTDDNNKDKTHGLNFGRLANGFDLINNLGRANIDNLQREREEEQLKRELESNKSKSTRDKKGKRKKEKSNSIGI